MTQEGLQGPGGGALSGAPQGTEGEGEVRQVPVRDILRGGAPGGSAVA